MLEVHLRGHTQGGSPCILYWQVMGLGFHSVPLEQGWKNPESCSLPRHHPPQAPPCHSSYTAPSGCCYQTQNPGVGTQDCDTADVGIGAYFNVTLAVRCSELAHQLNDCNENVTLETLGCFLQPTLLSPKKIKRFILLKPTNIKSCPSTWRHLANGNTIPLSVSHFIRHSKEKRKRS